MLDEDPGSRLPDLRRWSKFFGPEENVAAGRKWVTSAKCVGRTSMLDLFMPDKEDEKAKLKTIKAKRFCLGQDDLHKCPVIKECLQYAIDNNLDTGVWGATSERERRRIAARRNAEMYGRRRPSAG